MKTEEFLAELNYLFCKTANRMPVIVEPQKIVHPQGEGDEEVAVLVIGDLQIGHKTPTTTMRIIANRMQRLTAKFIKIVRHHRKMYPVKRLEIFLLGDLIQSEDIGFKVGLDELEDVLMGQMFKGAIPILEQMLVDLSPHFDQIDVRTVSGNHGRLDRFHADTTNWDTIIYKILETRTGDFVNWHIEGHKFWQKVKIWRKTFLVVHGDQIRMWMNIPWYGITQRLMRWQGSLPGDKFHYMVMGHFHVISNFVWNDVQVFVNGCFVSDDQWVLKQIGMQSSTSQWAFGVHPRQGVTWRYQIGLD